MLEYEKLIERSDKMMSLSDGAQLPEMKVVLGALSEIYTMLAWAQHCLTHQHNHDEGE